MTHLLDVNVLIALGDEDHPHAELAMRFFEDNAVTDGWATCAITENGFLRIVGNSKYPNGPGSPNEARRVLSSFRTAPGHQFWRDELSLCDSVVFPTLPGNQQLTDAYLLGLAAKRGGKLVTFDRHIDTSLVKGGSEALFILGGGEA